MALDAIATDAAPRAASRAQSATMLQRAVGVITGTRFVQAYMRALNRRPLTTKCATSGTLMLASDGTRQWLEQGRRVDWRWDASRTGRLTVFAVVLHAPFLHAYHPWVERAVWPRLWATPRRWHTPVKCALDQVFVAPVFSTVFLSYAAMAEGGGVAGARSRVEQQLGPLWWDSARVWGPAHLVTFSLPVPVRVLWQDVVRLYFGTLMSLRANAALLEDPP